MLNPLEWPLIRVLGPQFWDTVYISQVNGAKKVKSDAQNSDSVQIWKNFVNRQTFGKVMKEKYRWLFNHSVLYVKALH